MRIHASMDEPLAKPENPHAQEQPGIAPDAPPARRRIAAWLADRDAVRGLRPLLDPETLELEPLAGNEDPVEALRASPPDLILLDADAPGADPRETCLTLRAGPATAHLPIVVVASVAGDEDRIAMLELGADDFLAKPYSTRELVLRMRAVLRRRGGRSSRGTRRERVLRAGPLQLYADEHRLVVGGREVFLTPTECRLMYLLALRVGRIQHRDSLLHEIWGRRAGKTTRTLDVHVHRLRRKLEPEGERLETVVGIGYRLRP
jgi:two-component system phosphate regulon response regulator PhoB